MNGRDLLLLCNFVFSLVGCIGICVYSSMVCERWYPWMLYSKYESETYIQSIMANCVLSASSLVATWVLWVFIRKEKCCGWILKIATICVVVMALVCNSTVIAFSSNKHMPGIIANITGTVNFSPEQKKDYAEFIYERYKGLSPSEIVKKEAEELELLSIDYPTNIQVFFYFQILFTFLTIYQIVDIACCDSVGEIEKKLTC